MLRLEKFMMIHRHKLNRSWLIGPVLVALALLLVWTCSCSLSRWEAEDGHSKGYHGLTIRFGTSIYIGDDKGGYTEADWTASGEQPGKTEEEDESPIPPVP